MYLSTDEASLRVRNPSGDILTRLNLDSNNIEMIAPLSFTVQNNVLGDDKFISLDTFNNLYEFGLIGNLNISIDATSERVDILSGGASYMNINPQNRYAIGDFNRIVNETHTIWNDALSDQTIKHYANDGHYFLGNPNLYDNNELLFLKPEDRQLVGSDGITTTLEFGQQDTGWTAMTGTATKGGFDTATVTLPQLAQVVKAITDRLLAIYMFAN